MAAPSIPISPKPTNSNSKSSVSQNAGSPENQGNKAVRPDAYPACAKKSACLAPVPNLTQDRSCHEQARAARVYLIVRDGMNASFRGSQVSVRAPGGARTTLTINRLAGRLWWISSNQRQHFAKISAFTMQRCRRRSNPSAHQTKSRSALLRLRLQECHGQTTPRLH